MTGAWLLQVRNQALGFVREPAAFVFNLLVPIFIVTIEGLAFRDNPVGEALPGYRVVDTLPTLAAVMFVMIVGLFGMSVGLASMIEARTLAGASLRPGGIALVVSAYSTVLLGMVGLGLLVAVGLLALGWRIEPPAQPVPLVAVLIVSAVAFLMLGAAIAGLVGSPRSAQGVCSAVFFPLLFLSGAVFPLSSFPPALQTAAHALPGYHLTELVFAMWLRDQPFPWPSLGYVVVLSVASALLTYAVFSRREGV